jgi:hypothetical protein
MAIKSFVMADVEVRDQSNLLLAGSTDNLCSDPLFRILVIVTALRVNRWPKIFYQFRVLFEKADGFFPTPIDRI